MVIKKVVFNTIFFLYANRPMLAQLNYMFNSFKWDDLDTNSRLACGFHGVNTIKREKDIIWL